MYLNSHQRNVNTHLSKLDQTHIQNFPCLQSQVHHEQSYPHFHWDKFPHHHPLGGFIHLGSRWVVPLIWHSYTSSLILLSNTFFSKLAFNVTFFPPSEKDVTYNIFKLKVYMFVYIIECMYNQNDIIHAKLLIDVMILFISASRGGMPWAHPLMAQILSFWHTNCLKHNMHTGTL